MPTDTKSTPNVVLVLTADSVTEQPSKIRWHCHRDVLARHSFYFDAMFASGFADGGSTILVMPRGIITRPIILDWVLAYMYMDVLGAQRRRVPDSSEKVQKATIEEENSVSFPLDDVTDLLDPALALPLLYDLIDLYNGADYLGMTTLCERVTDQLAELAHHWSCFCTRCVTIVPFLYEFTSVRASTDHDSCMISMTRSALGIMTADPEQALAAYWTAPAMLELLVAITAPSSRRGTLPTLDNPLSQAVVANIQKGNAIESLYGCFLARHQLENKPLEDADILMATVRACKQKATKLIATHFDFYCSQYPTLLSCIDGVLYTSAFTEYLLRCTLDDQLNIYNAIGLYRGLVRYLMIRHRVQKSKQLTAIVNAIKSDLVTYIQHHLDDIQQTGHIRALDDHTVQMLANDLVMPVSLLVHEERDNGMKQALKQFLFRKPSKNNHAVRRSTTVPSPHWHQPANVRLSMSWTSMNPLQRRSTKSTVARSASMQEKPAGKIDKL
ncbi:hypothetical protein BC940DRAFT_306111 [Gongronella butleri]|nr:hypothetical protein BC940DRAFT_306111 [Gongronella butleri]